MLTLATLMASQAWPNLAVAIWAVFLSFIAAVLCADFVGVRAQPVNYESIHISGGTIEYLAFGQKSVIRLNEVTRLEFVREEALFPDIDGPYIESKWLLQSHDGPRIEVMDEWPHRKQLLQAFREHLPHFDEEAARAGLKARGEGRWLCYQASRTGEGDV
ncbi:MAG TPA: hypothetical protein VFL64_03165 [Rhizobacter sp.]|nr:hypothetical protein [Rhizobacter sp.]